jgi:hypothetical protein
MGPINYAIDIPDPSQAFLQAFKTGTAVTDVRMAQEESQRKAEQQKQIQAAFDRLRQPGATAKDYANLSMLLPETQAKAVRESFSMLNTDQQQSARTQAGQVFSAFRSGKPEIAIGLIESQIQAKRNSGDESGAKFLETWRDVAKESPKTTEDYFGGILAEMPGGKDVLEAALKLTEERRAAAEAPFKLQEAQAKAKGEEAKAKVAFETAPDEIAKAKALRQYEQAKATTAAVEAKYAEKLKLGDLEKMGADLGLTKAQTGSALATAKKLGIESQKATLELAALKATGGMDPAKTFDQEEKLRKEYQGRTKVYSELGSTYQNIKASSEAKNGPGDIALITGFMKMLDPGSVVRETEFATARDTAGLYERLLNTSQKLQSGQLFALDSKQRQEYVNLAKQYLDSAQKKANEDKKALGVVVKNYRLNPDNVFGQEPVGGGRGAVNPSRVVTVDY